MESLGERLQKLRVASGLSQQELASRAGVSYSTVTKLEQGATTRPSAKILLKLSDVLEFDLDEFLLGKAKSQQKTARGQSLPKIEIKPGKFKFVYFDVGRTLVHIEPALHAFSARLGRSYEQTLATWYTYVGLAMRGRMSLYDLQLMFLLKLNVQFRGKRRQEAFKHIVDDMMPIKPMHELVKKVAEQHKVGLLTNTLEGFVPRMRKLGLIPRLKYDAIIESSDVGCIKPEPKIYEIAVKQAKTRPEHILFIDDSTTNVEAAKAAGWQAERFDEFAVEDSIDRIVKKYFS